MVQVESSQRRSKTPTVSVDIVGINRALAQLIEKEKFIEDQMDHAAFQSANFLQGEVQESIIGRRAEKKSVDTGLFGNHIMIDKIKRMEFIVYPEVFTYPGTNTTTADVALWMERGTKNIRPRRHFEHTLLRNEDEVVEKFRLAISHILTKG